MTVNWYSPAIAYIPIYTVEHYILEKATNSTGPWTVVDDNITEEMPTYSYNSYDVDVSEYACGTTVYFRVQAVSTNGAISEVSDWQAVNIFKYSEAPLNLSITNTSSNNGLISMTINFDEPNDIGCGNGYQYVIKINDTIYDSVSYGNSSYSINATNLEINNVGNVEVYLQTTNPNYDQIDIVNQPIDTPYLNGSSVTAPYIAFDLTLEDISYEIYTDRNSELMQLSWNSVDTDWVVDNYEIEVAVNENGYNSVTTTDSTSYTYDPSPSGANHGNFDSLDFRVIAHLYYDIGGQRYYYDVTSNTKSINIFRYAGSVQGLDITNTSVNNDNTINMTIYFEPPTNIGSGEGYQYVINIDGEYYTTRYYGDSDYTIYVENLTASNADYVEIYLQTYNTNSGSEFLNGDSMYKPYIAYALTLNPIVYDIYTNRNSENMALSWNEVNTSWTVNSYDIEINVNDNGFDYYDDTLAASYGYDASQLGKNDGISFKIIAHMSIVSTQDSQTYNYNIESNTQFINVFRYSTAPQNLSISNTSASSNNLSSITLSFDKPSDIGSGNGYEYIIYVNEYDSYRVTYIDSQTSYTLTLTSEDFGEKSLTGTIDVSLLTTNTNYYNENVNDQGDQYLESTYDSEDYVSFDLTLDSVDYEVYTNNTQNMNLSWNSISAAPWSLDHYSIMLSTTGVDGSYSEVTTKNSDTTHTYLATQSCGTTLTFKIIAHMTNSLNTFEIVSNTTSINIFKYALAPASGRVNWSVTDPSTNAMDINLSFTNSTNTGCGTIYRYVIDVIDVSDNIITTKYRDYDIDSTGYTVNFNNVNYANNGSVNVYLQTYDENSEDIMNGIVRNLHYYTDAVPYYYNSNIDRLPYIYEVDVVSNNPLGIEAALAVNFNNSTYSVNFSTNPDAYAINDEFGNFIRYPTENESLDDYGVAITKTIGPNNEFIYHIVFNYNLINFSNALPVSYSALPELIILATGNTAGVKLHIRANPLT